MKAFRIILWIDLSESFGRNFIRGVNRYSDIYGPWQFCKMPLHLRESEGIEGIIDFAKKWKAHGIIGLFQDSEEVKRLMETGLKLISIDFKEPFEQITNVSGDYLASGELAAEYFLAKGYKNFGFYGTRETIWSRERESGFEKYLNEKGYKVSIYDPGTLKTDNFWYYWPSPLKDWLTSLPKPTAILACDDNRAEHILEASKLAGIKIPEELAVLGVDNDEVICQYSNPTLSSCQQDEENGGFQAAAIMEKMIREDRNIKNDIILKPLRIITRRSSEAFAIEDPHVKDALVYIDQNLESNIQVTDLLPVVGLSRRALERRFLKVMGRSVYKEIQRQRMEKVVSLLLDSNLSVYEISLLCGYSDSKNLSRVFSEMHSMSPIQFRKKHRFS